MRDVDEKNKAWDDVEIPEKIRIHGDVSKE